MLISRTDNFVSGSSKMLENALFVGYKQSHDNARSIDLSLPTNSTHMIEDETFNDSDIINNLIDYEDRQEEPDLLKANKIDSGIQICNKSEKHERSLKFQKELRSCISGYRDVYKQMTK
ncbi:uncharacterized protein TNCV_1350891 [Trichonephila clavipes]|nr:uncharacterized protein TNCV_1350891 [Trichonephila clavipes]